MKPAKPCSCTHTHTHTVYLDLWKTNKILMNKITVCSSLVCNVKEKLNKLAQNTNYFLCYRKRAIKF